MKTPTATTATPMPSIAKEADGEITSKLIVTYAYTLKYRQELEQMENQAGIEMGMNVLRSLVNFGASIDIPSQPDSQSTGKTHGLRPLCRIFRGWKRPIPQAV